MKKNRPLPEPPERPFGRKNKRHSADSEGLVADELARAAAEGRLGSFMEQEIPGGEYGRKLAGMMMGMTGMMPPGFFPSPETNQGETPTEEGPQKEKEGSASPSMPPEDVIKAVQEEDLQGLMGLLKREHERRSQGETSSGQEKADQEKQDGPVIEKEIIDKLIEMAGENNVSPDWLILRAIKLYVREYQKTGRL